MRNESIRKIINVDQPNRIPIWSFKQEDDGVLRLSLFKGSTLLDITGQTIKLGAKRPNNSIIELTDGFEINSNELDIILKNNILAIPGIVECDLEITDVVGKMTTASFYLTVTKKMTGEDNLDASNDISAINKIVAEVLAKGKELDSNIKVVVEEANKKITAIDTALNKKLNEMQEDYNSLQRIIINENQAANLQNQVNQTNAQLETKANEISVNANKISSLETQLNSVSSGSPKGVYATVSDLTTAFPSGNTNIYVVSADGGWYYWNGSSWTKGGEYQSTSIGEYTIKPINTTLFTDNFNLCRGLKHGKLNTTSGVIVDHANDCVSNPIYSNSQKITVKNFDNTSNMGCCLAFYKADGTFLGTTSWGIIPSKTEGTFTNNYTTDTAYFVFYTNLNAFTDRIMIVNGQYSSLTWKEPFKIKENFIEDYTKPLILELQNINNSDLFKKIEVQENGLGQNFTNVSIDKTGVEKTYAGWYTSDYKICKDVKKVNLVNVPFYEKYTTDSINAISFYDKDKNFIQGFANYTGGYTNPSGSYTAEIVPPLNSYYYRTTKNNEKTGTITLTVVKKEILQRVEDLENGVNKQRINVLCIGDSLTEGDYGSEPEGTKNVKEKNYPYFMNQVTGWNVTNKGKCGFTPSQYWNNFIKWGIDFDGMKYDVVIIMLGTNGGMTDTLEADTTITSDQTYEDYANTGTGNYCKIIEYINEKMSGKTQIILCTCPFVDSSRRPKYVNSINNANIVIPKIANKYSLPLIDIRNKLGLSNINTSIFQPIDGLHFGEYGYSRLGTFIANNVKSILSY